LYGGGNILLKAKNVFKGLQGVENVYTQHVPLMAETLRLLASNDLNTAAYPYAASTQVRELHLHKNVLQANHGHTNTTAFDCCLDHKSSGQYL
jgi:hypothetical protein